MTSSYPGKVKAIISKEIDNLINTHLLWVAHKFFEIFFAAHNLFHECPTTIGRAP